MKNYILLYITIISVISFNCSAQKAKIIVVSDKQNDNYANIDALKTYERVVEKGYKSADMFKKLGNSYYYDSEFSNAAKWYAELFAMTSNVEPEYYYRYAQSLRSIAQNDKANEMLEKFNQLSRNNTDQKLIK